MPHPYVNTVPTSQTIYIPILQSKQQLFTFASWNLCLHTNAPTITPYNHKIICK